ncbi:MAG: hypothetical protein AVDCRST_MAG56-6997 [uncultured Cytophagales bacterium]|uniref:Uncharacterized protein n=1 Tax=uncultured Cytophagales bacterium TaxID=158755 RepID=A0A6J4L4U9_9SPHI|nr:MAG: hypothetical protein AVDCRST_MAG56-6997 [uncultured Cytophagales bacterium]
MNLLLFNQRETDQDLQDCPMTRTVDRDSQNQWMSKMNRDSFR